MRLGTPGRILLLVLTHAALFLVARRQVERHRPAEATAAGEGGTMAPAATKLRERGGADPGHEDLLRELVASALNRKDFEAARAELFRDWIRRDPRTVMDLIFGVRTCGQYGPLYKELGRELRELFTGQPREIFQWMADDRYGSNREKLHWIWLQTLIDDGQSDLVLELVPRTSPSLMHGAIIHLCMSADLKRNARVRELLISLKARPLWDGSAEYYVERQLLLTGGDVGALLGMETDAALRRKLATVWVPGALKGLDGGAAAGLLLELPEDVRKDGFKEAATHGRNLEWVAAWLEESDRLGLSAGISDGEMAEIVSSAVACMDEDDPEPADAFARFSQITRKEIRESALKAAGDKASFGNPLETVDGLPAGADRDAFLTGMLERLGRDDGSYLPLAEKISDPALREIWENQRREQGVAEPVDGN